VSHGDLSSGILNSIKLIAGDIDNVEAMQLYPGGDPKDLVNKIEQDIKSNIETQIIIFTDLKGGSVHNAMISLCVHENVNIISGFNLGMVLDTVLSSETDQVKELTERAVDIGRNNIELFNKRVIEKLLEEGGE